MRLGAFSQAFLMWGAPQGIPTGGASFSAFLGRFSHHGKKLRTDILLDVICPSDRCLISLLKLDVTFLTLNMENVL